MSKNYETTPKISNLDPFGVYESLTAIQSAWLKQPEFLNEEVQKLVNESYTLWTQTYNHFCGGCMGDVVPVSRYDERFKDEAWTENPYFDLLKESYLLYSHWLVDAVFKTPDVDDKTKRMAAFWTRQFLDAISPSNFYWTNPLAQEYTIESGGQNLRDGFMLWLQDLKNHNISMVEPDAFSVGKSVAASPGEVVYRNRMLELIQYAPATEQVHEMPIFLISPWINKFYILDLAPGKSLIEFLVHKGFTVFVTSWKNPDSAMRDTGFEDYMFNGALDAIEVICDITGQPKIHAAGYCIGGTLLSMLMSWMNQGKEDIPVANWTLFTTLVDFSDPGDIDVFITEKSVAWLEEMMEQTGYLDGQAMEQSFRMLRPNGLIWRYVMQSYLYGKAPPPLEVLFWNTDVTRLPAKMHSYYLRELYLNNNLVKPNALKFKGRSIDLGKIKQPLYAVGAEQDHISPWKETFRIARIIDAPVRYALATSGHIMGIVNPPDPESKRRYWVGDATDWKQPDEWLAQIKKRPGTWWDDWTEWLDKECGEMVPARRPGSENFPPLAPAPGEYVLEK